MNELDERHTMGWQQRDRERGKDVIAERVASSKSDELRSIGSFSVLSEPDRQTLNRTRNWVRRILLELQDDCLPGCGDRRVNYTLTLDGLERDGLNEILDSLDEMYARNLGEPQLIRRPDSAAERAHASERENVCGSCGGRVINGTCLRNCDRD